MCRLNLRYLESKSFSRMRMTNKFQFLLSLHLSPEDKAVSRGIRVLIEEHLYKFFISENYISESQVKLQI